MTLFVIIDYYSAGECNFVMALKGLIKILVIVRSVRNSELSRDFKNFSFQFTEISFTLYSVRNESELLLANSPRNFCPKLLHYASPSLPVIHSVCHNAYRTNLPTDLGGVLSWIEVVIKYLGCKMTPNGRGWGGQEPSGGLEGMGRWVGLPKTPTSLLISLVFLSLAVVKASCSI